VLKKMEIEMTFVAAAKAAEKWAKRKKEMNGESDEQVKVAPKAGGRKRAEPAKKNAKPSN
jgi:hypothetical protein